MNPEIVSFKWGEIKIRERDGENFTNYTYKDCKLFPGGSIEWDWAKTGTHHKPGIQIADVDDLITEHKDAVILLTRGMDKVLEVTPALIKYLEKQKRLYKIGDTKEIVEEYNKLVLAGTPVVGLFHMTC